MASFAKESAKLAQLLFQQHQVVRRCLDDVGDEGRFLVEEDNLTALRAVVAEIESQVKLTDHAKRAS